ncbi:MAG: ribosomal protein L24e family protein [archaeon]|nr:ribosomal protein L24e family protein [archaeon]
MVIKYQTCEFSDYKVAPGHGMRYCEVNGKTHMFVNKKVHRLFRHGKKPLTIRWSLKWRTSHKKGKIEEAKKKVIRQKKEKQIKAVVGLSVDEIQKIRDTYKDSKQNDAQRYKYAQEIKEKRKKYLEKVKKGRGDTRAAHDKIVPKVQKGAKGKKY